MLRQIDDFDYRGIFMENYNNSDDGSEFNNSSSDNDDHC